MAKKLSKRSLNIARSTKRFIEVTAVPGGSKTSTGVARVAYLLGNDPDAVVCVLSATNATTANFKQRLHESGIDAAARVVISTLHALVWKLIQGHFRLLGLTRCPTVLDAQQRDKMLAQTGRRPGGPHADDAAVSKLYAGMKRAANKVDFDDMLRLGLHLVPQLSTKQLGFDHLVVDEWQDSPPLQAQIIAALATRTKTTMVFGDPLQMIYGFAGGRYIPFKQVLRDAGIRKKVARFELDRSYRLTAETAALAMAVVEPLDPPSIRTTKTGKRPVLLEAADSRSLAIRVAKRVKKLLDRGIAPSEIALLGRVRAVLRPVAQELAALGVPTLLAGSSNHYQAVLDVLFLADKLEDLRAYGIGLETVPGRRRSQMTEALRLEIRAQLGLEQSEDFAVELGNDGGPVTQEIGFVVPSEERWEAFFDRLIRVNGGRTLEGLYGSCLRTYLWLRGGINSNKDLRNALNAWQPRCRAFETAAAMAEHVRSTAVKTEVTCSTIHAAKGMEWDHVFVIGVTDGVLPDRRANAPEQRDEERRMLYVAITRARERLLLAHSPIKVSGVRKEYAKLSRFLRSPDVHATLRIAT